jgi:hypothetical protein
MNKLLKIKTPIYAVLIWFFVSSALTILIMILSGLSTAGGGQIPMIVFSYSIYVIPSGVLLICLLSPFVYRDWFKKYWFIIVIIAAIFALPFFIAFG